MTWVTYGAIFFIVWWISFFAILPIGLRTQDDEKDITLGTVSSAPSGPHMRRAVLWTTLLAVALCGAFYSAELFFGLSLDDIPHFIPER